MIFCFRSLRSGYYYDGWKLASNRLKKRPMTKSDRWKHHQSGQEYEHGCPSQPRARARFSTQSHHGDAPNPCRERWFTEEFRVRELSPFERLDMPWALLSGQYSRTGETAEFKTPSILSPARATRVLLRIQKRQTELHRISLSSLLSTQNSATAAFSGAHHTNPKKDRCW